MNRIIYIILFAFILSGCRKEYLELPLSGEVEGTVTAKISFIVPPVSNTATGIPNSRSAQEGFCVKSLSADLTAYRNSSAQSRANVAVPLYNLYVFQFSDSGNKVVGTKIAETPTPVNNRITLDVKLNPGTNQTVYLVALGKQCDMDLLSITTKAELEKKDIEYLTLSDGLYSSKIKTAEDLPYSGYADGLNIVKLGNTEEAVIEYDPASDFNGGIFLRCLVAKVSLFFKYQIPSYTLTGILLKSVPNKFGINPTASADNEYYELDVIQGENIVEKDPVSGYYVVSWYLAPNLQGENQAIINESDRYINNAPANASYFEVWVNKNNNGTDYAIYSIYIGSNNTTDFNIKANGNYQFYTDFSSTPDDKDFRIRTYVLKQIEELMASDGPAGKKPNNDIDAHYDRRPITVVATRKQILVELLDATTKEPVGEDCWLKLSADVNYTKAFKNKSLGKIASRTIVVPSQVRFYLYSDEYVTQDAPNRSVIVRITTSGLDGQKISSYDYTMTQRPIMYIGRWGGDLDESEGQYTKNLGISMILEYTRAYSSFDYFPNSISWGYMNVETSKDYGTHELTNGLLTTRELAENLKNLTIDATGVLKITQHVLKDGKVDIYQYDMQNSYAARYCYDKNRDLDGNGIIDYRPGDADNELRWYLPSANQIMAFGIQSYADNQPALVNSESLPSTLENSSSMIGYISRGKSGRLDFCTTSGSNKVGGGQIRCVRDLDITK